MMPELLNIPETADVLRISTHTLRVWTRKKKIPCVRLGRRVLFRKRDVESFIRSNVKQ